MLFRSPKVNKLTWDNTKERYIHGIGVAYRDETGKIVDNNPPPALAASAKEPLAKIKLDSFEGKELAKSRYVPHGPLRFSVKNGGVEFLSGNGIFFPNDWPKKGVTRDGWYRFRVKAGAFAGEGADARKDVKLVLEYNLGSPIEVVKSVLVDAPVDAPKDYEFLMYLQQGPPDMNRSWELRWDNGGKEVEIGRASCRERV